MGQKGRQRRQVLVVGCGAETVLVILLVILLEYQEQCCFERGERVLEEGFQ